MTANPQFVLDTSITMAWCFEDEADAYADAVLDVLKRSAAVAPELWMLEVANVLLVGERRNRITRAETDEFLQLLGELPIQIESAEQSQHVRRLVSSGREGSLTAYDTAYLLLAKTLGLPLATRDEKLRLAAAQAGVHFFEPDAPPTPHNL